MAGPSTETVDYGSTKLGALRRVGAVRGLRPKRKRLADHLTVLRQTGAFGKSKVA